MSLSGIIKQIYLCFYKNLTSSSKFLKSKIPFCYSIKPAGERLTVFFVTSSAADVDPEASMTAQTASSKPRYYLLSGLIKLL